MRVFEEIGQDRQAFGSKINPVLSPKKLVGLRVKAKRPKYYVPVLGHGRIYKDGLHSKVHKFYQIFTFCRLPQIKAPVNSHGRLDWRSNP
jgi:hypothetical protein